MRRLGVCAVSDALFPVITHSISVGVLDVRTGIECEMNSGIKFRWNRRGFVSFRLIVCFADEERGCPDVHLSLDSLNTNVLLDA